MAQQTIGTGASANDGTGDTLRTAFGKCNDNFTELYGLTGASGGTVLRPSVGGSGKWHLPWWFVGNPGTVAAAANTAYFVPFTMSKTMSINALSINVTTLAAGNVKMAIYSDSNGVPGTRLVDCTSTTPLDTGSTGVKATSDTFSQSVDQGTLVWLAALFSAAPTVSCATSSAMIPVFYADSSWARQTRLTSTTNSYATGLPSDATTLTLTYAASNMPLIAVQFA